MRKPTLYLLGIMAGLAVTACHHNETSIPVSWRNPGFEDAVFRKLFVIGVGRDEGNRRLFEDTFVKALEDRGAEAQPSWASLPQSEQLTEEQIREAIEGGGFDGVIITRLLAVEQTEEYVEGKSYTVPTNRYGYGYYGYYGTSYATVHESGHFETSTNVRLETNLYSVATGGLVWSGQSDTVDPDSIKDLMSSVTAAVVKRLADEKLIP